MTVWFETCPVCGWRYEPERGSLGDMGQIIAEITQAQRAHLEAHSVDEWLQFARIVGIHDRIQRNRHMKQGQQSLTGGAGFERGYDLIDDSKPEVVNVTPDHPDDEPPINPFEDDNGYGVSRDRLVDELLFMYENHGCCSDPELLMDLRAEVASRP